VGGPHVIITRVRHGGVDPFGRDVGRSDMISLIFRNRNMRTCEKHAGDTVGGYSFCFLGGGGFDRPFGFSYVVIIFSDPTVNSKRRI
jgi:hypothetical protein